MHSPRVKPVTCRLKPIEKLLIKWNQLSPRFCYAAIRWFRLVEKEVPKNLAAGGSPSSRSHSSLGPQFGVPNPAGFEPKEATRLPVSFFLKPMFNDDLCVCWLSISFKCHTCDAACRKTQLVLQSFRSAFVFRPGTNFGQPGNLSQFILWSNLSTKPGLNKFYELNKLSQRNPFSNKKRTGLKKLKAQSKQKRVVHCAKQKVADEEDIECLGHNSRHTCALENKSN